MGKKLAKSPPSQSSALASPTSEPPRMDAPPPYDQVVPGRRSSSISMHSNDRLDPAGNNGSRTSVTRETPAEQQPTPPIPMVPSGDQQQQTKPSDAKSMHQDGGCLNFGRNVQGCMNVGSDDMDAPMTTGCMNIGGGRDIPYQRVDGCMNYQSAEGCMNYKSSGGCMNYESSDGCMNYRSSGGCMNYEVDGEWKNNEGCMNWRRGGGCLLRA